MRFLISTFILLTVSVSFASKNLVITLDELNKKISNPKETLMYLYNDPLKWQAYLAWIERADEKWLQTWVKLVKVSDGGASQELSIAANKALDKNSKAVFSVISKSSKDKDEALNLVGKICDATANLAIDNESLDSAGVKKLTLDSIKKKKKQFKFLKSNPDFKSTCLQRLDVIEAELAK